jgi:hypothetical protein
MPIGLDGRERDKNGEIRKKRADAMNANLARPIPEFPPEMTIGEGDNREGQRSGDQARGEEAR